MSTTITQPDDASDPTAGGAGADASTNALAGNDNNDTGQLARKSRRSWAGSSRNPSASKVR